MDRGAWRATVHRVARVRHDLATKPPLNQTIIMMYIPYYNAIQSIFTANRKNFCAFCVHLPANSQPSLIFLLFPQFCIFQNAIVGIYFSFLFFLLEKRGSKPFLDHLWPTHTWTRQALGDKDLKQILQIFFQYQALFRCLAQQPREGAGGNMMDACRKATPFVSFGTMNTDSCLVCCKQTSHFFRVLL